MSKIPKSLSIRMDRKDWLTVTDALEEILLSGRVGRNRKILAQLVTELDAQLNPTMASYPRKKGQAMKEDPWET